MTSALSAEADLNPLKKNSEITKVATETPTEMAKEGWKKIFN